MDMGDMSIITYFGKKRKGKSFQNTQGFCELACEFPPNRCTASCRAEYAENRWWIFMEYIPVQIQSLTMRDVISDEGEPVLSWSITYPQFICSGSPDVCKQLNIIYYSLALGQRRNFLATLFPEAVRARAAGSSALPHEAVSDFKTTFTDGCLLSLYTDTYVFTGGAHGNTVRSAQTWNMQTGANVRLCELFPNRPDCEGYLIKEIRKQISQRPDEFFEDSGQLAAQYFNPERFYLTPDGIEIFYGQYEIAPYSSGMPTFLIPYDVDPVQLLCRLL